MDDRPVGHLAARQHSLVTFEQAVALGLTPEAIRVRLDTGRWERRHMTVYRIAGSPDSYGQRLLAACLGIGAEAAASHRAASTLHGLLSYRDPPVEVTTTRARSPELADVTVHRMADLHPRWTAAVDGVPCTTVARTLVDLGAVAAPKTVEAALDRAIGRRLVTVRGVRDAMVAVARQGRRGIGAIRAPLVARTDADRPAGVFEARMASLLRSTELPPAHSEYTVRDLNGGFVAVVDFAFPDRRLAIEVDGYEPHTALGAFQQDRSRDRLLAAVGWLVLHFAWSEVDRRLPHVGAEISEQLRRRPVIHGFSAR
jgi:Protein of unknown function (DUF559)